MFITADVSLVSDDDYPDDEPSDPGAIIAIYVVVFVCIFLIPPGCGGVCL